MNFESKFNLIQLDSISSLGAVTFALSRLVRMHAPLPLWPEHSRVLLELRFVCHEDEDTLELDVVEVQQCDRRLLEPLCPSVGRDNLGLH